ncbi:MAG: cyclase family protein [Betaproteobacteria bacterium]
MKLLAGSLTLALCALAQTVAAQTWTPPTPEARCPSKWGADDVRGAANLQTAQQVLKAARLIRTGELIELGRTLTPTIPLFGTRKFDIYFKPTGPAVGSNRRRSNEELIVTELGQVGTQIDMFAHQMIGDMTYNCVKVEDIATRGGLTKMGVDGIGALFTRGVLIDVAALKGVDMLQAGYEITTGDLQAALQRENLTIEAGDAVFIHTGWGKLWGVDNARYNASCPGIGAPAAEWLAKQDIMLMGSDNFPVEVAPNPDQSISLPVHQIALVVNGIFLLENVKLDELAEKQIHEFAFTVQPLKIKGGTGSTVAPVAIH